MSLREMVEDLQKRRDDAMQMGGPDKVARQHERGKLTCRERMGLLFDKGTFQEFGIHATHQSSSPQMAGKKTPADGVVTGLGKIDGRWVAAGAYDFTVLGGSIGQVNETKMSRLRAGAAADPDRVADRLGRRADPRERAASRRLRGHRRALLRAGDHVGRDPRCARWWARRRGHGLHPRLADFVPMVKGTSSMALRARRCEGGHGRGDLEEDLGGSKIHTEMSASPTRGGQRRGLLRAIREYFSYFLELRR
jgi:acetyl-CoA carboxylase carboxyltransferase component